MTLFFKMLDFDMTLLFKGPDFDMTLLFKMLWLRYVLSLQGTDYVCISDNYWLGKKKPCITYGLRYALHSVIWTSHIIYSGTCFRGLWGETLLKTKCDVCTLCLCFCSLMLHFYEEEEILMLPATWSERWFRCHWLPLVENVSILGDKISFTVSFPFTIMAVWMGALLYRLKYHICTLCLYFSFKTHFCEEEETLMLLSTWS